MGWPYMFPTEPSRGRLCPSSCSPLGCGRTPSGLLASQPKDRPGFFSGDGVAVHVSNRTISR
eukprot:2772592-Pleurochrysis_carterae.AAC.1